MQSFLLELWHRLVLSYKSTFLGLLVVIAGELLKYYSASTNPYIHLIVAAVTLPFLAWKDKAVADGTISLLPPRGFIRVPILATLTLVCLVLGTCVGCGWIHKELGARINGDELNCADSALHELADKLVPDLTVVLATAETGDVPAALAQLEVEAVASFGASAKDGLTCAAKALVADYELVHAPDAGVPDAGQSPEIRALISICSGPSCQADWTPQAKVHQRALDYLASRQH